MEKTQIFFVELSTSNKLKIICDISELFYNYKHSVAIYARETKNITTIDQLLWTWKQDAFIPHSKGSEEESAPVVLFHSDQKKPQTETLIQYDPLEKAQLLNFKYVVDFAELYDNTRLNNSRKRYKELRDSGAFSIQFLKLGAFLTKVFDS